MSEDQHQRKEPVYVNVMEAVACNIQRRLGLKSDINGERNNQEENRLRETWRDYFYSEDRRLGVGSKVVIPEDTAIRTGNDFRGYITTSDIEGILVKETSPYWVQRNPLKWKEGTEMVERTDGFFTVEVKLPPDDGPQDVLNPDVIRLLVPNDHLRKTESK